MSEIQSIIFKQKYFTIKESIDWLKRNDFYPIKPVDITTNYYRFRILKPDKSKQFRIISLTKGVKAVIMY